MGENKSNENAVNVPGTRYDLPEAKRPVITEIMRSYAKENLKKLLLTFLREKRGKKVYIHFLRPETFDKFYKYTLPVK